LASVNAAGAPRPGAQVLAVTTTSGELQPVIAAQQYGLGRSIIFTGEASWRWRMLMPAKDTTYELVWRQLTRWLSSGAVDAIEIPPSSVTLPGTTDNVMIVARDQEFKPISDAEVTLRVREPGGQERSLPAAIASAQEGRYAAPVRFDQAGVYTIAADVRRGSQLLGTITRPMLVGGYDVELSEPHLNEPVLQRIADSTGGRYIAAAEAASLPTLLRESGAGAPPLEMRDLWNTAWSLLAIILLLATEWLTRRRVGLA
jgi:Ca-activated chloride channel family protein